MVYQVIATAVDWERHIPETGTLTTITETIKSDATFLLLQILTSALKQATGQEHNNENESVILVSFEQIFIHYSRILRKLGVNVDASRQAQKLFFVDGVSELSELSKLKKNHVNTSTNVSDLMRPNGFIQSISNLEAQDAVASLMQAILGCTANQDLGKDKGEGKAGNASDSPKRRKIKGIFIHGLSVLADIGCGANTVRLFINTLKTYLQINGGFLVVLTNADSEIIAESEAEDDFVSLLTGLLYQSDLVFQVEPLTSGYSADVTGQISIVSKPHYKEKIPGPSMLHYKTYDNKAVFFAPGQRTTY